MTRPFFQPYHKKTDVFPSLLLNLLLHPYVYRFRNIPRKENGDMKHLNKKGETNYERMLLQQIQILDWIGNWHRLGCRVLSPCPHREGQGVKNENERCYPTCHRQSTIHVAIGQATSDTARRNHGEGISKENNLYKPLK